MSLDGQVIDERYRIERMIGQGGMGEVYEGLHTGLGRKVAIKVLRKEYLSLDLAAKRFYQEAEIAGNLGHANICEVTDIGTTDEGLPYMVMPYLDGRALADEIVQSGEGISARRAVTIIAQILEALQVAHEAGIVHRDLKPENIFLVRMGDREDFVKVLDFGISKVLGPESESLKRLTATGMVLGTPYYMAPEQASGAKDLDHRVDIYAVGVLLFELLTGSPPFEGDSYNEIIVRIVNEPFPSPREWNPKISEAIESVILKSTAKDRDKRFQTVREFKQFLLEASETTGHDFPLRLSQIREGENPSTLSSAAAEVTDALPTVSLRPKEPQQRSRWKLLAGGIVVGALVVGLIIVLTGKWSKKDGQRHGPEPSMTAKAMTAPTAMTAPDAAVPMKPKRQVRIRFTGLPKGGQITVDGRRVQGDEITLWRGTKSLRYQARAPGHQPDEGSLIPDQNQQIRLRLLKKPKAVDASVPMHFARPMVIWGRDRTRVKTGYDSED